jgi:hypothetical protein
MLVSPGGSTEPVLHTLNGQRPDRSQDPSGFVCIAR